jgi:MoxR-like ATPase
LRRRARISAAGTAFLRVEERTVDVIECLERRLVGYRRDLLQVLVAVACAGRPVLLIGRHGLGKTTLASHVARLFGGRWVHYDAAKDDLVTVAGLPDAAAMAEGRLAFCRHPRTIWDKDVVLVDEVTRAHRENQNLWLEVLERGCLFGEPLACRLLIATCNPDDYSGTVELDEALLDRFAVVLELPTFQRSTADLVAAIARVNLEPAETSTPAHLELESAAALVSAFAAERARIAADRRLLGAVAHWCGEVVAPLLAAGPDRERAAISPRTFGSHLPHVVLDLVALDAARGRAATSQSLVEAAELAALHVLGTKCRIEPAGLARVLKPARKHLLAVALPARAGADPLAALAAGTLAERVAALARLDRGALAPADRLRSTALGLDLAQAVLSGAAAEPALVTRLREAAAGLTEVRELLECALLRGRLHRLLESASPRVRQQARTRARRVSAVRTLAGEARHWSPAAPAWSAA